MATARAPHRRVALCLEDLEAGQQDRIRAALSDAGIEVAGGEDLIVITGPSARRVEELRSRVVVAVLPTPDRPQTTELINAGASGVLSLEEVHTTLAPAIHAVASGLVVVPVSERDTLLRAILTARETEILALVIMGLTNADIGRRLYLAESTVKYHLLSIYGKLGVRTRQEATNLVLDRRNGLAGVLGLTGARRARGGTYSRPEVS
jgi:DNA-binding NarL/FixJ family response regulator